MSLFPSNTYYDTSKFVPTYLITMIEIEKYISKELFKNDLTRIFYSSPEFSFRQRLNLLAKTELSNTQDFKFPFCSYIRSTNFELDINRLGVNSGIAYGSPTTGIDIELDDDIIIQNCRFMQTITDYNLTFFYNNDFDYQVATETLLWIKRLTPKQWIVENALEYGDANVSIPIVLRINNISTDISVFNEENWLKSQRIFPISVNLSIQSLTFDQTSQGETSTLFKTTKQSAGPSLYLSKQIILDYLTFKGEDPFLTENNVELIVDGIFNPDPSVSIDIDVIEISETSAKLTWNITLTEATPGFVKTVHIFLNTDPENPVDIASSEGEYTLINLVSSTNYVLKLMFETTQKTYITIYKNFTTLGTPDSVKGIVGIHF